MTQRKKYGDTKGKTVINTVNGEKWKSCKLAARAVGISYCSLRDRLNGRVKNETTLIYRINQFL